MASPQPGPRPVLAWLRTVAVVAVVVGADQLTKAVVRAGLHAGERRSIGLGVHLVEVRNRGVAFGLFSGGGRVVSALIAAALLILLAYFALHATRPLLWLPVGLLLGGALGNLVDRARHHAVTDFIDPPLWPAFNLADVAITIGVLSLLAVLEPRRARE